MVDLFGILYPFLFVFGNFHMYWNCETYTCDIYQQISIFQAKTVIIIYTIQSHSTTQKWKMLQKVHKKESKKLIILDCKDV